MEIRVYEEGDCILLMEVVCFEEEEEEEIENFD